MNDIKSKLINAANKQQINTINKDDIINSVDKRKVKEVNSAPRKRFNFVPLLAASVILVFAVGFMAIGIKVGMDNSYKKEYGILDVEPEDIDNGEPVFDDLDNIATKELLNHISNQAVYNIINIANTLPDIKFDDVLDDATSKNMTPALEKSLVSDINYYIYNLEDMFGFSHAICEGVTNPSTSQYKKSIYVTSPYYEYSIHYNEIVYEEENVDQDNYKSKSNINGIISCGLFNYNFETLKIIKNSAIDYNTKIMINENDYVIVDEKFSDDLNFFQYNFYIDGKEKDININQSLTADGATKEIGFNSNNKLFQAVITKKDEKTINCKLKKRNSDVLTITLNEDNYLYTFKNSENQYTIEK